MRLDQEGWDATTMGFLNYITMLNQKRDRINCKVFLMGFCYGDGCDVGWCCLIVQQDYYYTNETGKPLFREPATKDFFKLF